MKLMGFNLTKIIAEKLSNKTENVKLSTNIDVSEIKEVKSDFFKAKEEMIAINFTYLINYEPNFAKIEISGNILLVAEPKLVKEILKQWKNKNIPEEVRTTIFNIILKKSSLKAFQLEEELNLPIHMPLPSVKITDKKDSE